MIVLLLASAMAAEPSVEFGLGGAWHHANTKSEGSAWASIAAGPSPVFAVELSGAWFPRDEQGLTSGFRPQPTPLGDPSPISGLGLVEFRFTPLQGRIEPLGVPFEGALSLGGGAVATRDDLYGLQAEGDPAYEVAEHQVHPALSGAASVRIGLHRGLGLRVATRAWSYAELTGSTLFTRAYVTGFAALELRLGPG